MVKFKVVRLCKQEAMSIVPTEVVRYDLVKAAELLRSKGYEVRSQGPMVIAKGAGFEATLYTSGRMLVSMVETRERAGEVATLVYEAVEGSLVPVSGNRA